jgi:hypothetical protein
VNLSFPHEAKGPKKRFMAEIGRRESKLFAVSAENTLGSAWNKLRILSGIKIA